MVVGGGVRFELRFSYLTDSAELILTVNRVAGLSSRLNTCLNVKYSTEIAQHSIPCEITMASKRLVVPMVLAFQEYTVEVSHGVHCV